MKAISQLGSNRDKVSSQPSLAPMPSIDKTEISKFDYISNILKIGAYTTVIIYGLVSLLQYFDIIK